MGSASNSQTTYTIDVLKKRKIERRGYIYDQLFFGQFGVGEDSPFPLELRDRRLKLDWETFQQVEAMLKRYLKC